MGRHCIGSMKRGTAAPGFERIVASVALAGRLKSLLAEFFSDVVDHWADLLHRLFQFLGGDLQGLGPVANFVVLVDIDTDAVGFAAFCGVVGRTAESLQRSPGMA